MKLTYPWARMILAVSEGVADDLAQVLSFPRERITLVYNPVIDHNFFKQCDQEPTHPWFKPDQPPIILGAGRLTKAKDFQTLIRAFAIARRQTEIRLVIIGEGEERSKLEAMVRDMGLNLVVDLPGFVKNPYPLFNRAHVFVLSSIWEGLPTVLIEALTCGTPVISTDCRSGPKEILENGRYGCLVPVGDHEKISAQILTYLAHPPQTPGKESWQRYSLDTVLRNYKTVLAKVTD